MNTPSRSRFGSAPSAARVSMSSNANRASPTELLDADNLVLLPHLGSATRETREAMGFRVLENLTAFFDGRQPRDRVA